MGLLVLWRKVPNNADQQLVASFDNADDLDAVKRYLEETNPLNEYWSGSMVHLKKVSKDDE